MVSQSEWRCLLAVFDLGYFQDLASLFSLQLEPLLCLGDWSTLGKSIVCDLRPG